MMMPNSWHKVKPKSLSRAGKGRLFAPKKDRPWMRRVITLGAALLLLAATFGLLDMTVARVALPTLKAAVTTQTTLLMEEAALTAFENTGLAYADLVELRYNPNGEIASLSLNSRAVAAYRAALSRYVGRYLSDPQKSGVALPLGSLTPFVLLSGRGPKITFAITAGSALKANVQHDFSSAGWNQTLHRVVVAYDLEVYLTAAPHGPISLCGETVLCETVLVGKIPQSGWLTAQNATASK